MADRNAADLWRGRYLLVPAAEIEPPASDEVFYHDLVGLRVERRDGDALGRVAALLRDATGVLLEVSTTTRHGDAAVSPRSRRDRGPRPPRGGRARCRTDRWTMTSPDPDTADQYPDRDTRGSDTEDGD